MTTATLNQFQFGIAICLKRHALPGEKKRQNMLSILFVDCRISYLCSMRICLAVKSDSLASSTTLLLVWQFRSFISLRYVDLLNEFKLQTICCGKSRNIESQTIDASTRDNLALISQRGQPASQPVNHIPLFDSLQSHVRNSSLMIRTKDSHKK